MIFSDKDMATGFQKLDNRQKYLQYGCGWNAPETWENFDASPTLYFERLPLLGKVYTKNQDRFPENVKYGNIISGLPVENHAYQAVYCSHVLEHLSLDDFRIALRNTYKLLIPGGIFRFVMPDLEFAINQYVNDDSPQAAIQFFQSTLLGRKTRPLKLKEFFLDWLGNSRHLWLWDYKSVETELLNVGFTSIRRAYFGDSSLLIFQDVESMDRWKDCLGVECQRPDEK